MKWQQKGQKPLLLQGRPRHLYTERMQPHREGKQMLEDREERLRDGGGGNIGVHVEVGGGNLQEELG